MFMFAQLQVRRHSRSWACVCYYQSKSNHAIKEKAGNDTANIFMARGVFKSRLFLSDLDKMMDVMLQDMGFKTQTFVCDR